jgi:SPX domain protein involved in polyphosphate accumulation
MNTDLRFEYKYLISYSEYQHLKNYISFFMNEDKLAHTNKYSVCSLYFDTQNLDFYKQKVEGLFEHNKIRMRQYQNFFDPNSPLWLESKQKRGISQIKKRIKLNNLEHAQNYMFTKNDSYFYELNSINPLTPSLLILYDREAYELLIDNLRLRITFDSNLLATNPENYKFIKAKDRLFNNGQERILLEIKYDKAELPKVILQLIKKFQLNRISFSKYAQGLDYYLR